MIISPFIFGGASRMEASGGVVEDIRIGNAVWRTHVFEESDEFVVTSLGPSLGRVEVFMVAGGGGGGSGATSFSTWPPCNYAFFGGGGGGGGIRTPVSVVLQRQAYPIVVGLGGNGAGADGPASQGSRGGTSSAFGMSRLGGGPGTSQQSSPITGGSGGGHGRLQTNCDEYVGAPGSGTSGQGLDAVEAASWVSGFGAVAGGGAGYSTTNVNAAGGQGYTLNWLGEDLVFGSGGGGGAQAAIASGGSGAGSGGRRGDCGSDGPFPEPGENGRGGGGGGGAGFIAQCEGLRRQRRQPGARGGDGIVVVRYRI